MALEIILGRAHGIDVERDAAVIGSVRGWAEEETKRVGELARVLERPEVGCSARAARGDDVVRVGPCERERALAEDGGASTAPIAVVGARARGAKRRLRGRSAHVNVATGKVHGRRRGNGGVGDGERHLGRDGGFLGRLVGATTTTTMMVVVVTVVAAEKRVDVTVSVRTNGVAGRQRGSVRRVERALRRGGGGRVDERVRGVRRGGVDERFRGVRRAHPHPRGDDRRESRERERHEKRKPKRGAGGARARGFVAEERLARRVGRGHRETEVGPRRVGSSAARRRLWRGGDRQHRANTWSTR